MLRLATIHPASLSRQYSACVAKLSKQFPITHVVGEGEIAGADRLGSVSDLEQRLDEFDACAVHSSAAESMEWLTKLACAGKHVLVDDGCLDVDTAEKLAEVARQSNVCLAVAQPNRFSAYSLAIREALDAGHLGTPGLVRIHHWSSQSQQSRARLWEMAVREVDSTCWFFGSQPDVIFGQSSVSESEPVGLALHLGFESGMAIIDCAFHAGGSFYTSSLIGSKGAAYADDHHNTNLLLQDGTTEGVPIKGDDVWLPRQLEAFADCIQGRATDTSVGEVKQAISICHAAIQSAESNKSAKRVGDRYELQ